MQDKIFDKLYEIIDILENSDEVIELKKLKEEIYKDESISKLLDDYHNNMSINSKREIINNTKIKRYRELENILYFDVLEINGRLKKLIVDKECQYENH